MLILLVLSFLKFPSQIEEKSSSLSSSRIDKLVCIDHHLVFTINTFKSLWKTCSHKMQTILARYVLELWLKSSSSNNSQSFDKRSRTADLEP